MPVAQALAVKDGRIVEVGGSDEILWLREDAYEVIDLEGRTVIPGFVDPHNHFSIAALETFWPDSARLTAWRRCRRSWPSPPPTPRPGSGCGASATITGGCPAVATPRAPISTPPSPIGRCC